MDEQTSENDFNDEIIPVNSKSNTITRCVFSAILGFIIAICYIFFSGPFLPYEGTTKGAGFILGLIFLLTLYDCYLIAKRILSKKPIRGLPQLLTFIIAFWLAFFISFWGELGEGSTVVKRFNVDAKDKHVSIIQIRHCQYDPAAGANHACHNILFIKKNNLSVYKLISILPRGKSLSIKYNLLYFHQEGCCDSPDLVTVIDFNGKLRKLCTLPQKARGWSEPPTDKDWEEAYRCVR